MDLTKHILGEVKEAIGLSSDPSLFDTDILMHINNATAILNQNGVGNAIVVTESTTWSDFQNSNQTAGNLYFHMIPLFITLSVKIIFDPPPPSNVQYHQSSIDQMLWRLKVAYEEPYISTETSGGEI